MRLRRTRRSHKFGPVRVNTSGHRLTSATYVGPGAKLLRACGYVAELWRAPRRNGGRR